MLVGLTALKCICKANSDFASITPCSVVNEKSSPRLSIPLTRHATGSSVLLRRNIVFVSFLQMNDANICNDIVNSLATKTPLKDISRLWLNEYSYALYATTFISDHISVCIIRGGVVSESLNLTLKFHDFVQQFQERHPLQGPFTSCKNIVIPTAYMENSEWVLPKIDAT